MLSSKPQFEVILLAAGLSTRMGARNKMLLPVRGQPLIRHVAGRLIEADIGRVHAVTGFEAERVVDALGGLNLDIIFNAAFETGQMSSVSAGFRAMPKSTTGMMIALGDMPHLTAADYRLVADAFHADGGRQIAVPFFNGERGNPIVIPARFMSEIIDGELNAGCRKLIARRPNDILRVEVNSPAFVGDIDTPEDFARVRVSIPSEQLSQNSKGLELGPQG